MAQSEAIGLLPFLGYSRGRDMSPSGRFWTRSAWRYALWYRHVHRIYL